ncbi:hypothetical protein FHG87_022884 [Trinorchestia longiramus]|nr:hypothetical protein FHG87_022884 [Trinorchestia longiramus]
MKYCEKWKATYSSQLFRIRGCNMEECRFCYSNHESAAIVENQSRKIQELSRLGLRTASSQFRSSILALTSTLSLNVFNNKSASNEVDCITSPRRTSPTK